MGEQLWRQTGVAVGLTTGDREIEFRPVPGYQQPLRELVSIISGEAATFITREYFELIGGGTGMLLVTIKPESIAMGSEPLGLDRLFPTPHKLARARFNNLGLVTSRGATIRRVAQAVCDGSLSFDNAQDPAEFCQSLMSIKGIGDWTAQYVAMRALKYPDAFPSSDLGLLHAVGESGAAGAKELRRCAEAWRPWRSYAALLLWSSLSNSGG